MTGDLISNGRIGISLLNCDLKNEKAQSEKERGRDKPCRGVTTQFWFQRDDSECCPEPGLAGPEWPQKTAGKERGGQQQGEPCRLAGQDCAWWHMERRGAARVRDDPQASPDRCVREDGEQRKRKHLAYCRGFWCRGQRAGSQESRVLFLVPHLLVWDRKSPKCDSVLTQSSQRIHSRSCSSHISQHLPSLYDRICSISATRFCSFSFKQGDMGSLGVLSLNK